MREESCKNCAHYPGCLTHSAAIFFYFVATGRGNSRPTSLISTPVAFADLCSKKKMRTEVPNEHPS